MSLFSIKFIVFLILTVCLYYGLPKKWQWKILLIASLVFYYICGGWSAGIFICVTIVTTFAGARAIDREAAAHKERLKNGDHPLTKEEKAKLKRASLKKKKGILVLVLLINFGMLGVLKYGNFVASNVSGLFHSFTGGSGEVTFHFLLPLGISFYTFQSMGYLIDVYRGKYEAEKNLFRMALFTSYFPQIIQGPIGRYDSLAPQLFASRRLDAALFRRGFLRLLWGFFKKMVIAERAAFVVNEIIDHYQLHGYEGFTIFFGVLFYGIQMYADFSGGMDMVFGVSDMLGISLTENFRQPFFAKSVDEFWKRWHITLGHWMRDYVFYPIALSKPFSKLQKRAKKRFGVYYGRVLPSFLASFIVFLLVGIWHGANWKYVVYGLYHATLVSTHTLFEKHYAAMRRFCHVDDRSAGWRLFQMVRTTVLVTFGRYFDCAAGAGMAAAMLRATFRTWNPWVLFDGSFYAASLSQKEFYLLILTILFLLVVDILNEKGIVVRDVIARQGIVFRWIVYVSAIIIILIFAVYGPGFDVNAFIYQQF